MKISTAISLAMFGFAASNAAAHSQPAASALEPEHDSTGEMRHVCEMPPAVFNDYLVIMKEGNPERANLYIMSFYVKGGWGKVGGITPMKRVDDSGSAFYFVGEDIGFAVKGNAGELEFYGAKFPCPLEDRGGTKQARDGKDVSE